MITAAQQTKTSNRNKYKILSPFDFNAYLKQRGIEQMDTVIVGTIKHLENIPLMMNDFSLKEWKDYLQWNIIRNASPYMNQTFIDIHFDFYGKTLKGKKELKKKLVQV